MKIKREQVICADCGSTDVRVIPTLSDSLIECRECGFGMLRSEFQEWKDWWRDKQNKIPVEGVAHGRGKIVNKVYKAVVSFLSWAIAIPINIVLLPFVLLRMVIKGV